MCVCVKNYNLALEMLVSVFCDFGIKEKCDLTDTVTAVWNCCSACKLQQIRIRLPNNQNVVLHVTAFLLPERRHAI